MKYKINEIFYSIQGEGRNTGMPAIFIRLAGCNLKCSFCDTNHSEKLTLNESELLEEVKKYPCNNIVITGGEPTEQNLEPLLIILNINNYNIYIETNGTNSLLALKGKGLIDWITVSPKTALISVDCAIDEIKVIYPTNLRLSVLQRINAKYHYLQPCDDEDIEKNTKNAIKYIKEHPKWRLSLQMHKILKLR